MRKSICVGLLTLSFLVSPAAGVPASAKSLDGMRALIPFDFSVGDQQIAAGEYTIRSLNDEESVLRIGEGRRGAIVLTNAGRDKGEGKGRARLVFHKYGDQYFLSAVWGADNQGRVLRESKRERSLRKEARSAQAGAAAGMEEVVVAAL